MDVGDAIRSRRTHKQYGAEPLDEATLRDLLDLARFAPNHHLTQPWRFRALGPETRMRIEAAAGEKEAVKLRRAPTLVLATATLSGDGRKRGFRQNRPDWGQKTMVSDKKRARCVSLAQSMHRP